MAYGKKNVIKINPFAFNIGLIGEGGVGKTTTIYEMCEKHLPEGGYIFVECGKEEGADALSNINYINCPDWNSEYDDFNNSVGFNLLIEDIIENKQTDYPNLEVVVIDTFDQLREIVEPEVIRLHNKQHPDKKVSSVKATFGGYMAGDDMCDDIILDKLWELKKVGVHFIVIGHTKLRELSDPLTGETYTQLTTDMSMRTFNKLKTKLHFLGVACVDRDIVKEQKGKKKELKGVLKSEARKITFRDDNFAIDSKSRFADIANECELNGEALYKTLCDAIEKEALKGNKTLDELKKDEEKRKTIEKKRGEEYSKSVKVNLIDNERNEELAELLTEKAVELKKNDEEKFAQFKEMMNSHGLKNFKNYDEIPTAFLEELATTFL